MQTCITFIVLFPLAGFILNGLAGRIFRRESLSGWIGSLAVGIPFLLACTLLLTVRGGADQEYVVSMTLFRWIVAGSLETAVSYRLDELSLFMTLIVTGVGFLIHVYSIGYMHGDRGFRRFFAFMNLFIFMMLNLVLADNYVLMFLGWEGVGLCSYLLIGFWYDRRFEGTAITWTGDAANKAFWVNRIGDFAFLLGLFLLFHEFGTLTYEGVYSSAKNLSPNTPALTWATLLLFIGATGKSAQIPLFIWLPDAMAGPTPVSALIHAATMVTASSRVQIPATCAAVSSPIEC
ncbi:MAG: proton-conducting transporter membrane subunit, partial [Bacteroidota bacterium]|nr:proton-conducting transporter membrane subunit [Bacteroidota bacterium]